MTLEVFAHSVQHCCDGCNVTRRLDFEQLEVGIVPDATGEVGLVADDRVTRLVALPACDRCGAVEFVHAPRDADAGDATLDQLWTRLGLPRAPRRPVADVLDDVATHLEESR